MRADRLLRQNIDTLLKARGQTRTELAAWCGRSRSWLSKIFNESNDPSDRRGINLKYLDKIADFFGLAAYQLFQPGISPLTERRSGHDRRSGQDRRISARNQRLPATPIRQIDITPEDEALLAALRELTHEEYLRIRHWIQVTRLGRPDPQRTADRGVPPEAAAPPAAPIPRTQIERKKRAR